jgi:hypothetical protein
MAVSWPQIAGGESILGVSSLDKVQEGAIMDKARV